MKFPNKFKYIIIPITFFILNQLTSCASIVEGDDQVVSIETPSCPGASCKLVNNQGTFYVSKTPGTVSINKSSSDLSIECTKGDVTQIISSESSTEGMTFGNIIFGGLIGVIVDASTGAAYEYDALIQHPLTCDASEEKSKLLDKAKLDCVELGFELGTEKHGECVLKLNKD